MAGIGLSKPYYAKYNYNESTKTASYTNGGVVGKAISFNMTPDDTNDNDLYADNAIAETDNTGSKSGTVSLGTDRLPIDAAATMLGVTVEDITEPVSGKRVKFDNTQAIPYIGLAIIRKSVENHVTTWSVYVVKKVQMKVPSDEMTTQGETVNWQTPTLEGTYMPDDSETKEWKQVVSGLASESDAETYIKNLFNITGGNGGD